MQASSPQVDSSQTWIHPRLALRVRRHLSSPWRKPPQPADAPGLTQLRLALDAHEGPLILDSFCGTGMSTQKIARQNPDALVIGVDKSAHRLHKATALPPNCLLLRAHCEAVWRELVHRKAALAAHFLLYPNPWPKAGHFGRRVHGHAAFPWVAALGGHLELRSNWQVYVEEFGVALHLLGQASRIASVPSDGDAMTLFEKKYRDSGHGLWRLEADLASVKLDTVAAADSHGASLRRGTGIHHVA